MDCWMLGQSNQKDRELHKVQINSGLTAKKLQITRIFKFSRSVTAVTLLLFASFQRQLWLCESSSHLQSLRLNRQTHTLLINF